MVHLLYSQLFPKNDLSWCCVPRIGNHVRPSHLGRKTAWNLRWISHAWSNQHLCNVCMYIIYVYIYSSNSHKDRNSWHPSDLKVVIHDKFLLFSFGDTFRTGRDPRRCTSSLSFKCSKTFRFNVLGQGSQGVPGAVHPQMWGSRTQQIWHVGVLFSKHFKTNKIWKFSGVSKNEVYCIVYISM